MVDSAGGQVGITDQGSANGTFVNGARVSARTVLRHGDRIDIGPFSLTFDGECLASTSSDKNAQLVCRNLSKQVADRQTGRPLALLDRVSIVVRPTEFLCLLGPSGSGKSTLLSILSGRRAASSGDVLLNGVPLHANFEALKQSIAIVPQQDRHHSLLSVEDSLRYTSQLRLPPDTTPSEVDRVLGDTIGTVQLAERRKTLIDSLSGGQLKRVSLATELVNQPSVLFLDEVTSGLDEQTDRDMMGLFASLASSGRTVVCITHNLANVEAFATHVAILTVGGKLAFFGEPERALAHFRIDRFGDVYRKMSERPAEEWRRAYQEHESCRRLVTRRMPKRPANQPSLPPTSLSREDHKRHVLHQSLVLLRRQLALMLADKRALAVLVIQSLLVAGLIGLVFGDVTQVDSSSLAQQAGGVDPTVAAVADRSVRVLFLLAISCLWFGCNNSAKEIVKERVIHRRERLVNLRADAYLLSQVVVLCAISGLQATALLWMVQSQCHLPIGAVTAWIALIGTTCAGVALGLLISSFAKTEDFAVTMVPVVLIPQIILAGFVNPLEGLADWLARLGVTAYWSLEALKATLDADYAAAIGSDDASLIACWSVLALHAAICVGATYYQLRWRSPANAD